MNEPVGGLPQSEIPAHVPARSSAPKGRIPHRLIQTFETRSVPSAMLGAIQTWLGLNPEYEYACFDAADRLAFIDSFDCADLAITADELRKAYRSVKPGAGKADLFRYVMIFDRGGIYMDIDTVCLRALRELIHPEDDTVSGIGMRGDLHQWGLIYAPRHPFLKRAIENGVRHILTRSFVPGFEGSLEGLAGPPCLDFSIKQLLGLPLAARFQPGLFDVPLDGRNWRIRLYEQDLLGGNVGFNKDYRPALSSLGFKHWMEDGLFCD